VLSHYAVHTPLQAKEEVVTRYEAKASALGPESDEHYESEREASTRLRQDHATYAAMIESTDESVGRIVEKIRELGIEDHTAVVFVSDNGGLSTLLRKGFSRATANVPLRAGKGWLYEGGIRAPLIVAAPGAPSGLQIDEPAVSTDLHPTLLDLAGLPSMPTQHRDGASLAAAIRGADGADQGPLYWHFPHYHGSGSRPSGAIRWGNLKLVEWFEDGAVELYDLGNDIGERRDLIDERPEEAARLLRELRSWRDEVGANMPTPR
jgi:arylsulfatase A-like enzyme